MTRRQYQEFQKAQSQEIHRVKMYKAKKNWVTAGITAFTLAVGLTAMSTTTAHAATSNWTARSTTEIQASLKSEGTEPYTIISGDTLSTIADAANRNGIETSVSRLAQINKISNIDLIIAGNKLWFNGSGQNGTVTVEDKNGASHTYNLSPNKPIQSGNNGNGTAIDTTGGAQSNTNNSSTANNGSGSSSNTNNSGNVNNGSNSSNGSNLNNGTGNNSNSNTGSNNGNNSSNGNNNNGSDGNSNNNGGTTDPTTPTTPNENEVSYTIKFVDYTMVIRY